MCLWSGIVSVLRFNLGVLSPNITLMLPLTLQNAGLLLLVACHYRQQCILAAVFAEVAGSRLLFAVIFSSAHCCHAILLYALMQAAFTFARLCVQWGWNHRSTPLLSTQEWLFILIHSDYNSICSQRMSVLPCQTHLQSSKIKPGF